MRLSFSVRSDRFGLLIASLADTKVPVFLRQGEKRRGLKCRYAGADLVRCPPVRPRRPLFTPAGDKHANAACRSATRRDESSMRLDKTALQRHNETALYIHNKTALRQDK